MASLKLHPRLPQELQDKILAYTISDETIEVEIVERGDEVTKVNLFYSPTLKAFIRR